MNREDTMMLLGEHARIGGAKGFKRASDLNRRGSDVLRTLTDTPLVAFDLLATGYDQDIIEIGAVRYEVGAEVAEFSTFVNPGRDVPPEELEGSGVTLDMLADAPDLADVITAFEGFLKNAVLAAHGDSYNIWLLRNAYKKVSYTLINPTVDALPRFRRVFDILHRHYPYPDFMIGDFIAQPCEPYRAIESARLCGEQFIHAFEKLSRFYCKN